MTYMSVNVIVLEGQIWCASWLTNVPLEFPLTGKSLDSLVLRHLTGNTKTVIWQVLFWKLWQNHSVASLFGSTLKTVYLNFQLKGVCKTDLLKSKWSRLNGNDCGLWKQKFNRKPISIKINVIYSFTTQQFHLIFCLECNK